MPNIRLDGVVKRFGNVTAISHVDLEILNNEFFVLLGPTGAGKTTTLRVIAGLEKIDEGRLLFDEEDVAEVNTAFRDVAFIFQSFLLYPHMSVRQILEFPLRSPIHREPEKEIKKRVEAVAEILHISPLLERSPDALSGGEMQRVGIGRAIIRKPKIFLMDEPLSNLDAKLREELRVELKDIQRELKVTTVYVTHDQIEAMSMGDRIGVLNKGEMQQIDKPKIVYSYPKNLMVARFVGTPRINLIPCRLQAQNGAGTLILGQGEITLPLSIDLVRDAIEWSEGKQILVGVRPEDVLLSKEQKQGFSPVSVRFVEHFGTVNICNLQIDDHVFKARTPTSITFEHREVAFLSLRESGVMFFDERTGEAFHPNKITAGRLS